MTRSLLDFPCWFAESNAIFLGRVTLGDDKMMELADDMDAKDLMYLAERHPNQVASIIENQT